MDCAAERAARGSRNSLMFFLNSYYHCDGGVGGVGANPAITGVAVRQISRTCCAARPLQDGAGC